MRDSEPSDVYLAEVVLEIDRPKVLCDFYNSSSNTENNLHLRNNHTSKAGGT